MWLPGPIRLWQNAPEGGDRATAYGCLMRGLAWILVLTAVALAGVALYAWIEQGWKTSIGTLFLWAAGFAAAGILVALLDGLLRRYL